MNQVIEEFVYLKKFNSRNGYKKYNKEHFKHDDVVDTPTFGTHKWTSKSSHNCLINVFIFS